LFARKELLLKTYIPHGPKRVMLGLTGAFGVPLYTENVDMRG